MLNHLSLLCFSWIVTLLIPLSEWPIKSVQHDEVLRWREVSWKWLLFHSRVWQCIEAQLWNWHSCIVLRCFWACWQYQACNYGIFKYSAGFMLYRWTSTPQYPVSQSATKPPHWNFTPLFTHRGFLLWKVRGENSEQVNDCLVLWLVKGEKLWKIVLLDPKGYCLDILLWYGSLGLPWAFHDTGLCYKPP